LQTCLNSRCVLVFYTLFFKGALDNDANHDFQRTIGFLDPSAQASAPGWPLRNLLAYLRAVHPEATKTLRVLCWRGDALSSRFGILRGGPTSAEKPSAVGWEKNVQGKLGARVADLAPMMDPKRLVSSLSASVHG
jgi:ubiquitin-like modifier-activating enzyme ATG7